MQIEFWLAIALAAVSLLGNAWLMAERHTFVVDRKAIRDNTTAIRQVEVQVSVLIAKVEMHLANGRR